jgi:two-component system chemotaxis response regulator CheY
MITAPLSGGFVPAATPDGVAAPLVLLVDDDPFVLAKLRTIVTGAGHPVCTAPNGAAALAMLETSGASIVVTDVGMPDMDGLELCRRIRAGRWPGYVYIVLLSAKDEETDILAGLDAGADDYLGKRMPPAHCVARLRTARRILSLEQSLRSAVEEKRRLAMTDALTGIYNRRYFFSHPDHEMGQAPSRTGDLALLVIDVDHFKQINDRFGHVIGDMVLLRLAGLLSACLRRSTDWCARLGGEEFAVVLEGANLRSARRYAERLRESVAATVIDTPAGAVRITISIGVSGREGKPPGEAITMQSLLEEADANLYTSKARGRNRVTMPGAAVAVPAAGTMNSTHRGIHHDDTDASIRSLR